eukprot:g4885.t1
MHGSSLQLTILAVQLVHRVTAQTDGGITEEDSEDDEDRWGVIVGLVVALVALGVLVVCLLVALCESRRNRRPSEYQEEKKPIVQMVTVEVQTEPLSPISNGTSEPDPIQIEHSPVPSERMSTAASEESSDTERTEVAFEKSLNEFYDVSSVLVQGSRSTIRKGAQYSSSREVAVKVHKTAELCLHEHAFYALHFNPQDPESSNKAKTFIPELIDGGQLTLSDRSYPTIVLEKGKFTLNDFLSPKKRKGQYVVFAEKAIFSQICHCIRFLHQAGFVHGDLNLDSIMFFGSRWKLLDFSSVGTTGQDMKCRPRSGYGAPEVVRALSSGNEFIKANPAIDIWSLGSIVYELMTHKPLLPESSFTAEEIESMSFGTKSFPWEARPYAFWSPIKSPAALKIMQNCLHRDPGKRWTIGKVIQYTQFWS